MLYHKIELKSLNIVGRPYVITFLSSQEEISQRLERWYKVFFMIDFGSYGSEVIISRGCVKF